jgi:hypothetical protein
MSPELAAFQASFAGALRHGAAAPPGLDERGFSVYRNTVRSGLCEALRLSYPVTDRLVGSPFFDRAALAFARHEPPHEPVLARYGAGFAGFMSAMAEIRDLPYLGDVMRLEWAVDQAGLDAPGFAEARTMLMLPTPQGQASLALAPSLRLLRLDHAVLAIWRSVTEERLDELEAADWRTGPEFLAIHHDDEDVVVTALSAPAWRLGSHLLSGGDEPADAAAAAADFLAAPFVRLTLSAETTR